MNVARDGYYTSEYIEHRRYGTPRSPQSTTSYVTREASQYSRANSRTNSRANSGANSGANTPTIPFGLPSLVSTNPDDLPEDMTPAQLTYLRKEKPRTVTYDNYYRRNRRRNSIDDSSIERVLKNTDELYLNEIEPINQRMTLEYSGYYIDQKKRYDEAEFVKPRMYTHKTFKDVFKSEDDDRLNPIDIVFEDLQKIREEEEKKKFARAVRNMRHLTRNDYESYDYETQKQIEADRKIIEEMKRKKQEEKKLKKLAKMEKAAEKKKQRKQHKLRLGFIVHKPAPEDVKEVSEDNDVHDATDIKDDKDDKEVFIDGEGLDDETGKRKILRQKLKAAKKHIENNYFDNYVKEVETRKQVKENIAAIKAAKKVEVETNLEENHQPQEQQHALYVGPHEGFNPLWNYLLSFLVYDLTESQLEEASDKIEEIVEDEEEKQDEKHIAENEVAEVVEPEMSESKAVVVANKKKRRKSKMRLSLGPAKNVLSSWNQPASTYFLGQKLDKRGEGMKVMQVNQVNQVNDPRESDTYDLDLDEKIVYYDDDDMIDDELVVDPETGELVPLADMPNGSSHSMLGVERGSVLPGLHNNAPLQIILNINLLIKRIKIMRIVFAPIDVIAEFFPNAQTIVVLVELIIFMWMLYELSLLIDALCMAVKAVCAPMIAVGRFMNRIV